MSTGKEICPFQIKYHTTFFAYKYVKPGLDYTPHPHFIVAIIGYVY